MGCLTACFDGAADEAPLDAAEAAAQTRFLTGLRDLNQTRDAIAEGDAPPPNNDAPWLFVQLADPQLGMLNSDVPGAGWAEELGTLRTAVDHINRLKPRFAIVCGDLVHEFPEHVGEQGDDERKARQTRSLQAALSRVHSDIGLVCLCGNHDVDNVPSRKSIRYFRNAYGEDFGTFTVGQHRCVVINSQLVNAKEEFWKELRPEQCEEIIPVSRQQDAWLDALAPNEPSLIFSHIPPFIYDDAEPKGYFNHEPLVRRRLLAQIRLLDRSAKWFTGHFHRNAGGWSGGVEIVVTSAVGCALNEKAGVSGADRLGLEGFDWPGRSCSAEASGLRCVCVRGTAVKHRFFSLKDVPADPLGDSAAW